MKCWQDALNYFYMKKVLVIGDLNFDLVYNNVIIGQNNDIKPKRVAGGSGLNASIEFKKAGFNPIVIGKVGDDVYGKCVLDKILKENLSSAVVVDKYLPTCICNIIYMSGGGDFRTILFDDESANDYNVDYLRHVIRSNIFDANDYVYLTLYLFVHLKYDINKCCEYIEVLMSIKAKLIVDIVPHNLYLRISMSDFRCLFESNMYMLIGEYHTFLGLMGIEKNVSSNDGPSYDDCIAISEKFHSRFYICRFGYHNISCQTMFYRLEDKVIFIEKNKDTGYLKLDDVMKKRGYGEYLTSLALIELEKY